MVPQWLIEKKREGESLTEEEIRFFINGFTDGSIPDYQMVAMAMAVYFIANVDAETVGRAVLLLGAGRIKTDDIIDHAVVYRASSKRAWR